MAACWLTVPQLSCPVTVLASARQLRTAESSAWVDALSASQGPTVATKHVGDTDVIPLHHQVYPRLPHRLSRRDRLNCNAVRAEPRPERTARSVAFDCRRCGRAALGRPDRPTGLVRIIPYWLQLWVDRAVGIV